jgi:gliding motility-associated-like protein
VKGKIWVFLILNGFNGNILYWEYSTDGGNTWSVISNTSSIQGYYNINSTTLYNAVVQNYPCPFVHSNTVTVQADKKSVGGLLLSDTVVCFGSNTGTLSVTNYSTTIIDWIYSTDGGNNWISLNNTNPFFVFSNLNQNTQYAVIVKNGVCPEDTSNIVNINVNMFNTAQVFPTDTSISLGYSLQIIASGGTQYNWYPNYNISDTGIYNPYVYPYKDTVYKVIVTNQYGCVDTASVRIFVKKDYNLVIANTITPNGDNLNDYFWIGFIENYPNNEVIIFNRYGQEIFKGTNYDNKKVYWDGTYQGNKVPDGAYYYVIKFKDTDVVFKGSINVISSH